MKLLHILHIVYFFKSTDISSLMFLLQSLRVHSYRSTGRQTQAYHGTLQHNHYGTVKGKVRLLERKNIYKGKTTERNIKR